MNRHLSPILYADDSHLDVELFRLAAKELQLKYSLKIAENGQELLDYLLKVPAEQKTQYHKPAVILLDLKMPKLDGMEALKIIRAHQDYQHVPIIMLTSSEARKDVETCYQLGANAYVVKPMGFNEFLDLVEALQRFWTYLGQF